ncbi:hypothetical protein PCA76_06675 [Micromonospora sp. LH3U1]|nr:hypothetical protein [Micromonospora sp. LH3U1]WCN82750.1 hypothetical protein PCA76_06675 [Micromonospora sp. LH3U1]
MPVGEHLVQPVHRALVERAERIGARGAAQPFAQHLGVAGRAEDTGQPPQLGAQRTGPGLADQRLEGAQITAEASTGHPHLVHGGVATGGRGTQPDQRIVRQQSPDLLADRLGHHLAGGRLGGQPGGRDQVRIGLRRRAQRPYVLRGERPALGARFA